MAKNKSILKQDTAEISRKFSYSKDNVQLNFVLRIDVKHELKGFLECLEKATVDVKAQIADIK